MSPTLNPTFEALDSHLDALKESAPKWTKLGPAEISALLKQVKPRLLAVAEEWVKASAKGKQLDAGSPLIGEEWASGPWATLAGLNGLITTLDRLAAGQNVLKGLPVSTRPDGQVVVRVFPANSWDKLLLSGFSAEVWQQPEVTKDNLSETIAVRFKKPEPPQVALILGAGNINSIPPLDALYKLVAEGQVCLVKLNPVNDYLEGPLNEAFEPLKDFVRFVKGDGQAGAWLTDHPKVDTLHITGSVKTHDVIVFGPGEEGEERRKNNDPKNARPMSSELGGVGPTMIVPGPWSKSDFRFQAEHLVTQKLHNGGFNCIASQLLVVPENWEGTKTLLDNVKQVLKEVGDQRPSYYPGVKDRLAHFQKAHPEAEVIGERAPFVFIDGVDPESNDMCFRDEAFGPVWAVVKIPASEPADFLEKAVAFANDKVFGTLGCQMIIHPATRRGQAAAFDKALADLRYGTIGVNAWSGVGFLLPNAVWGAFPGHPLNDAQSGIGVVHNALLFDKAQKTVVRGPFKPFPRTLSSAVFHSSPKPLWFVTHKKAARGLELLTKFEGTHKVSLIPPLFAAALSG